MVSLPSQKAHAYDTTYILYTLIQLKISQCLIEAKYYLSGSENSQDYDILDMNGTYT